MKPLDSLKGLKEVGYEKPRAALAMLCLSLFGTVYLMVGLSAPPGWGPAFISLAVCYLAAFVALATEAFWSRWFASGLGWSGLMVGIAGLVTVGWHPVLAIYTGVHGLVVMALLGPKMAARYDLQTGWRQRYGMDEFGVIRLRKAVTRASASLPSLIIWALAPKEGQGAWLSLVVGAAALTGLWGLLRLRSWALAALASAGVAAVLLVGQLGGTVAAGTGTWALTQFAPSLGACAGAVLIAAVVPFVGPVLRYFRSLPR